MAFEYINTTTRMKETACGKELAKQERWETFKEELIIDPRIFPISSVRSYVETKEVSDKQEVDHMVLTRLLGESVLEAEHSFGDLSVDESKALLLALSYHDYHEGYFGDLPKKTREQKVAETVMMVNTWQDLININPYSPDYVRQMNHALNVLLADPKIALKYGVSEEERIDRGIMPDYDEYSNLNTLAYLYNEIHDLSFTSAVLSSPEQSLPACAVRYEVAVRNSPQLANFALESEFARQYWEINKNKLNGIIFTFCQDDKVHRFLNYKGRELTERQLQKAINLFI